jgi:hypothetical protein
LAEFHRSRSFFPPANDGDHDLFADRRIGNNLRQFIRAPYFLAVKTNDQVTGFNTGGLCRPIIVDIPNESACLNMDAKIGALGGLILTGRLVRRSIGAIKIRFITASAPSTS